MAAWATFSMMPSPWSRMAVHESVPEASSFVPSRRRFTVSIECEWTPSSSCFAEPRSWSRWISRPRRAKVNFSLRGPDIAASAFATDLMRRSSSSSFFSATDAGPDILSSRPKSHSSFLVDMVG